eukprot:5006644-Pleurochrysis_carterae.AAC.1
MKQTQYDPCISILDHSGGATEALQAQTQPTNIFALNSAARSGADNARRPGRRSHDGLLHCGRRGRCPVRAWCA